jgi:hypothetical protein
MAPYIKTSLINSVLLFLIVSLAFVSLTRAGRRRRTPSSPDPAASASSLDLLESDDTASSAVVVTQRTTGPPLAKLETQRDDSSAVAIVPPAPTVTQRVGAMLHSVEALAQTALSPKKMRGFWADLIDAHPWVLPVGVITGAGLFAYSLRTIWTTSMGALVGTEHRHRGR